MHEQTHHPPPRTARPMESAAKPTMPVRRPVASGDVAAEPPAAPPPIVARILRACAACRGQEDEQKSEKLALSQPGDPLEREADQVADRVMRTADPAVDRAPPVLRVSRARDDDEALLARAEAPGATSTGAASMVRDTLQSSGQPLSQSTRAFMEPRFGRDFGGVRVHTDARASQSAEAVSALAYTVGSNIVFRSGQYAPESPAGARLLAHELAHVAQQAPGAPIQRSTDAGEAADKSAADGGAAMTGAKPASTGVIVEDDATDPLDPKQMRKGAFLAALRPRVDEAVDAGYSSVVDRITGRAVVAARFAMYGAQSAKSLEQTLHREVGGAGSAAGYMGAVVARVRAEVAADEAEKNKGKEAQSGGIFFKGREGGARAADDPRMVKAALGQGGHPLPSSVRVGMESAMGQDFSGVRVHTGATAANVSGELNARALTVGQDIAFAAGEYQPGTPIGDALIAHELAHVVQQGSSGDAVAPKSDTAHDGPLETAADEAAVGAVLSMWGGVKSGALGLARKVGAGLKSGLKLQRCAKKKENVDGLLIDKTMCECRAKVDKRIAWAGIAAGTYASCDVPANPTGDDVEACFKKAHPSATVVATTSPSGVVTAPTTPGPCGPIVDNATAVHEGGHARHTDELARAVGPAFFAEWKKIGPVSDRLDRMRAKFPDEVAKYEASFNDGHDWAQDEVNSYTQEKQFLERVRGALGRVCS